MSILDLIRTRRAEGQAAAFQQYRALLEKIDLDGSSEDAEQLERLLPLVGRRLEDVPEDIASLKRIAALRAQASGLEAAKRRKAAANARFTEGMLKIEEERKFLLERGAELQNEKDAAARRLTEILQASDALRDEEYRWQSIASGKSIDGLTRLAVEPLP